MRRVRILEEASREAMEAAAWYEHEQVGLGLDFFAAIDAAINTIEEDITPLLPMPDAHGQSATKRLILDRFPYDIVTLEMPKEVIVIAVAHHSRKPGFWRERGRSS